MTSRTDAPDVLDRVVGQETAMAGLRAAARSPVHAYLLVGAGGSGKRAAAQAFAAALLCSDHGCGVCDLCARVMSGAHPDVIVVERQGAGLTFDSAREIRRLAMRTPNEAHRKVLVLTDFHLAQQAAAVLLKVVEEPPPSTVFVILAEHIPQDLVTIASRCVVVHLAPLTDERIEAALVAEGIAPEVAATVAPAARGRLDRARLLASDPEFAARRDLWRAVPRRLDGTGAAVVRVASELADLLGSASVAPLEVRHADELADLERRVEQTGERGSGRKEVVERHRRELRRLRTDELRFGLAMIAGVYRDALVGAQADSQACLRALVAVQDAAEALVRNPNEPLLLQALLLKLPPLPAS